MTTVAISVLAFLTVALLLGAASLALAVDPTTPTSVLDLRDAIADRIATLRGNRAIEPASIITGPLTPNDTPFGCVDPPPPGINNADIWVDSNGDGLPGPDIVIPAATNFAVDVWIDSHSYVWTNFFIGLQLVPQSVDLHQYLTGISASFHVSGGEGFPLDDFTLPWAVGLGGFLFPDYSGTLKLLTFSAQTRQLATPPGSKFCITPIVYTNTPEAFFCTVGRQPDSFSLFCAGTVDSVCYTIFPSTAEESATWGRIKGLFR